MLDARTTNTTLEDTWGTPVRVETCESCQWRWIVPADAPAQICPNCCRKQLSPLEADGAETPHSSPPEQVIPFELPPEALARSMQDFCAGVPFRPDGLSPARLQANLRRIFLPMWLVDASVTALWEAEAGFDYEVVSHQEHYDQNSNGWVTKELKEQRVRWEKRAGRLRRDYHNVAVPALEQAAQLQAQLGGFDRASAQSYRPEHIHAGLVRLPDLSPDTAWSEAVPAFQKAAAQECQRACGAGHLRQYRWDARFTGLNWTLLLLPVFATYYLDEDGKRRPVLFHGQTGRASGQRRASTRRAGRLSLILLAISIFAVLFGLLLEVLLGGVSGGAAALGTAMMVSGFLGVVGSGIPYLIAHDFNRRHTPDG